MDIIKGLGTLSDRCRGGGFYWRPRLPGMPGRRGLHYFRQIYTILPRQGGSDMPQYIYSQYHTKRRIGGIPSFAMKTKIINDVFVWQGTHMMKYGEMSLVYLGHVYLIEGPNNNTKI